MGKVFIPIVVGKANTGGLTASPSQVLADYTFVGSSGEPETGNIQSLAGHTYTPATTDQVISAGQYLSGAQTLVGDPNFVEGNIKKGVVLFGKTGTWEGYVASATDWYYRGSNPLIGTPVKGPNQTVAFDSSQITITNNSGGSPVQFPTTATVNLTGYSTLVVEGAYLNTTASNHALVYDASPISSISGTPLCYASSATNSMIVFSFSSGITAYFAVRIQVNASCVIYRIRLA